MEAQATRSLPWQDQLKRALRTAEDLHRWGLIAEQEIPRYREVCKRYRLTLPPYYAGLIDREDPGCPIRLQSVPHLDELDAAGLPDPLSDRQHRPVPLVTHRYTNRILLHLTPNCSMYCRYCFRKTLLNEDRTLFFGGALEKALAYVRAQSAIEEVIFSGGDPLLAAEATLCSTLDVLSQISHVRRIRFHSRVPVTLPQRVTPDFTRVLIGGNRLTVLVTHFNHPREITPESRKAIALLSEAGIRLLNQTVLLRRVNDDANILGELGKILFELGVQPYYLHHPDPAQGTSHFWLDKKTGAAIYHRLRSEQSGYLVPRYVVDEVGAPYKREVRIPGG